MPISVTCRCGAAFQARNELAGKQIDCVSCGQPIHVPAPTAAPMQPAPNSAPVQPAYASPQNPYAPPPAATGAKAKSPAMLAGVAAALIGVAAAGGGMYVLNGKLGEMTGQVDDLKQRATAGDEVRDALGAALKKEKAKITELRETAKTANEKQKSIRTKLAVQDTKVGRLSQKIAEQRTEMDKALAEAKQGNADAKKKAEELQTAIDALTAEMKVAKEEVDQFKKELVAATDLAKEANDKLKEADDKIAGLQAKIDALPPAYVDQRTINHYINPPINPVTPVFPPVFPPTTVLDPARKVVTVMRCDNYLPAGWIMFAVLDTATGNVNYIFRDNASNTNWPLAVASPSLAVGPPGRFDLKHCEISSGANKGKLYDFVLLDTYTGQVWHSTLTGWSSINCAGYQIAAGTGPRFQLDMTPESETFSVTNIGPSLGASNAWANVYTGTGHSANMIALP